MIIITDNEFFEGLLGGFAWIIAVFYIRNAMYLFKKEKKTSNIALIGAISWAILWIIRKIGMNLYKNYKQLTNKEDITIKLPFNSITHILYLLIFVFTILYIFVFRHTPKSNKIIMRTSSYDIPMITFIFVGTFFVYK